ncbi:cytochrome P450, family 71, subfamily B, polypeptide 35 [Hibiscus trionum]|uniref:Cytochrome P450, family 71, subfamily B, polypeptide 35 n=1 Tax=Hibiscus trionum TaxID=183268 RepID=A0A9W7HGP7_HIBTR|nr:cytochrome P450, family 71, subfamily B, polypeptide 35 [Hibiscus trionum]
MSPTLALVLVLIGALCSILYIFRTTVSWPNHTKYGRKLPPGPRALPIIGNLLMLGKLPHQNLHHLAKRYGPIMSLRLGSVPTIVVSSPQAAELFLKTHDIVFASRPKMQASEYLSYGAKAMAFTPYGSYWRTVRKWCTLHFLSASKVEYFAPVRKAHLGYLVQSVKNSAAAGETVDLTVKVGELIEDTMCQIIFGRGKDDGLNLRSLIDQIIHLHGLFNISDFIPYLAPLDLQGIGRRLKRVSSFETSAVTTVWAFSEILRHPRVMLGLQQELETVIGRNRFVQESDLPKLTYLDMVVKESLRLHPVAPFLVPRESMEDIVVDGYLIPKNSRILVNTWSMGRDPNIWSENAEEFFPERFLDGNIDLRGQHFELIPFGSGRRGCLMECLPHELDMSEIFGLTLPRVNHLLARPTYRLLK